MSNIFELLKAGFEDLNERNEAEILEKLKTEKDERERARLEKKLKDIQAIKGKKKDEPKGETMAEAMARRMDQQKKNEELRKKQIKRYTVDGQTGELVEVTEKIESTRGNVSR